MATSTTTSTDQIGAGIVYMLFGVATFAAHDMMGKLVVDDYPVMQMLALRAAIACVLLVPFLIRQGLGAMRTTRPLTHLLRLGCFLAAIGLFFTSVRTLPLADATAIAFGAPFLMTAMSVPFLKEQVDRRGWLAIAVGFAGVLVIVRPTGSGFEPAALLALGASVFYAAGMVATRHLGRTDSVSTMIFWVIAGQAISAGLVTPFVWVPVAGRDWLLLAGFSALNLLGQFALIHAFTKAPVARIAPLEYTALVWAAFYGFVVFGDVPGANVWVGAAIIIAAGLWTTWDSRTAAIPPAELPAGD